jgi:chemotaxis protein methyltransferase CheR
MAGGAALAVALESGAPPAAPDVEGLEVDLLLEAVYRQYGYDFREYARSSIKRRLRRRAREEGVGTLSGLQELVLHDRACLDRLLRDLSINVTSMFRDPRFFQAFRTRLVPLLRTYPFIRIWNAGCSTGEEAYSLAILLEEEGLYDRTRIYATDIDPTALERAQAGQFSTDRMRDYAGNYQRAGATRTFSDYCAVEGGVVRLSPALRDNIVFAEHNLASDAPFQDFHVITCRNVMIYFGHALQHRVHDLLYGSLERFGVLALGQKETIRFTRHEDRYEPLDEVHRLYRKVG